MDCSDYQLRIEQWLVLPSDDFSIFFSLIMVDLCFGKYISMYFLHILVDLYYESRLHWGQILRTSIVQLDLHLGDKRYLLYKTWRANWVRKKFHSFHQRTQTPDIPMKWCDYSQLLIELNVIKQYVSLNVPQTLWQLTSQFSLPPTFGPSYINIKSPSPNCL